MPSQAFMAGAQMALQAAGIKEKRIQQQMMKQLYDAQIGQMLASRAQSQRQEAALGKIPGIISGLTEEDQPDLRQLATALIGPVAETGQIGGLINLLATATRPTPTEEFQQAAALEILKSRIQPKEWKPTTKKEAFEFARMKQRPPTPSDEKWVVAAREAGISPAKLRSGDITRDEAIAVAEAYSRHFGTRNLLEILFGGGLLSGITSLAPKAEEMRMRPEVKELIERHSGKRWKEVK